MRRCLSDDCDHYDEVESWGHQVARLSRSDPIRCSVHSDICCNLPVPALPYSISNILISDSYISNIGLNGSLILYAPRSRNSKFPKFCATENISARCHVLKPERDSKIITKVCSSVQPTCMSCQREVSLDKPSSSASSIGSVDHDRFALRPDTRQDMLVSFVGRYVTEVYGITVATTWRMLKLMFSGTLSSSTNLPQGLLNRTSFKLLRYRTSFPVARSYLACPSQPTQDQEGNMYPG